MNLKDVSKFIKILQIIGSNSCRFKGITRPIGVCILYDERTVRPDCVLAHSEERLPAHKVALWRQDQHYL